MRPERLERSPSSHRNHQQMLPLRKFRTEGFRFVLHVAGPCLWPPCPLWSCWLLAFFEFSLCSLVLLVLSFFLLACLVFHNCDLGSFPFWFLPHGCNNQQMLFCRICSLKWHHCITANILPSTSSHAVVVVACMALRSTAIIRGTSQALSSNVQLLHFVLCREVSKFHSFCLGSVQGRLFAQEAGKRFSGLWHVWFGVQVKSNLSNEWPGGSWITAADDPQKVAACAGLRRILVRSREMMWASINTFLCQMSRWTATSCLEKVWICP
jgi:hypothetical protein